MHLNELQEKYGPKGLSILAVTNEGKSDTERWVADKGVRYAYAYDKSDALGRYFNVTGIPAAALVNAQGVVVWRGHPGQLDAETIDTALKGALATPVYEWPKTAAAARAAFGKRDFAGAIAAAEKMPEPERSPVLDGIRAYVTGQVEIAQKAFEDGNLLLAQRRTAQLSKELGKLPEAEKVGELVKSIAAVPNVAAILAALEQLETLDLAKLKKKKDGERMLDTLKKIAKELPDTYAEKVAKQKLDALARILPGLK